MGSRCIFAVVVSALVNVRVVVHETYSVSQELNIGDLTKQSWRLESEFEEEGLRERES